MGFKRISKGLLLLKLGVIPRSLLRLSFPSFAASRFACFCKPQELSVLDGRQDVEHLEVLMVLKNQIVRILDT